MDNVNIRESEYIHFIEKAQAEHYFVSVVATAPPTNFEEAAKRSTVDISAKELQDCISMYEPLSLEKLAKKGSQMIESHNRLSPRGGPPSAST